MREKTAEELTLEAFQKRFPEGSRKTEKGGTSDRSSMPSQHEQVTAHPRFPDDYTFAQQLVKGTREAWSDHFRKWETRSAAYIERRYPGLFNDEDKENILQDTEVRLLKNNMKYLREYRGMQRLSTHIQQQLEWATLTELRKKVSDILTAEENIDAKEDTGPSENDDPAKRQHRQGTSPETGVLPSLQALEVPQSIMALPDKQRWAFLLRYYDDFGFPESEIALLARGRGVSPDVVSQLIDEFLESRDNVLSRKRAAIAAADNKIQKCLATIYILSCQRQKLESDVSVLERKDASQKIKEIEKRIDKARHDLANAITQKRKSVVETGYEIIGKIMGEESLSTIRGHLFQARKYLVTTFYPDKKQIAKTKRPSR